MLIMILSIVAILFLIIKVYYPIVWVNSSCLDNYFEMKYTVTIIMLITLSALRLTGSHQGGGQLYVLVIVPFYVTVISGVLLGRFTKLISVWEIVNISVLPVILPFQNILLFSILIVANVIFITYCFFTQKPLAYKKRVFYSSLIVMGSWILIYSRSFGSAEVTTTSFIRILIMFAAIAWGNKSVISGILNSKDIPREDLDE